MKILSRSSQKLLKVVHLLSVGIWLSCVLVLLLTPLVTGDMETGGEVYMYNLMYYFIDMYILTPAAVVTLLTGIIYSAYTKWGFFIHGWLVYKWIVTLIIIVTGTVYLGPLTGELLDIADLNRLAALEDVYYLYGTSVSLWAAAINSLLLIVAVIFSVYKPWKNFRNKDTERR